MANEQNTIGQTEVALKGAQIMLKAHKRTRKYRVFGQFISNVTHEPCDGSDVVHYDAVSAEDAQRKYFQEYPELLKDAEGGTWQVIVTAIN